jgi:hypothetical protein
LALTPPETWMGCFQSGPSPWAKVPSAYKSNKKDMSTPFFKLCSRWFSKLIEG